jgi:ketosteroid isomerase-like protein
MIIGAGTFHYREDLRMASRYRKTGSSKPIFWGCLALVLFLSACGQQTPPDTRAADESTIRDLDAQWSKAAGANDVDGTVSYYSDDASVLPPNAPIATTKEAIRAAWASILVPGASVSWQPSKVEVTHSSDLAYAMGSYESSSKDSRGKLVEDKGKYVEVWKKQADGKWKTVADIFNSDLPTAPAEKKTHAKPRRRPARRTRRARRA